METRQHKRIRENLGQESEGQANLLFVAWDGSQGTAGSTSNVSTAGGTTPFSFGSGLFTVTVNPVPIWVGSGAALTPISPGTYSSTNQTTPAGNTIASVFGGFAR